MSVLHAPEPVREAVDEADRLDAEVKAQQVAGQAHPQAGGRHHRGHRGVPGRGPTPADDPGRHAHLRRADRVPGRRRMSANDRMNALIRRQDPASSAEPAPEKRTTADAAEGREVPDAAVVQDMNQAIRASRRRE